MRAANSVLSFHMLSLPATLLCALCNCLEEFNTTRGGEGGARLTVVAMSLSRRVPDVLYAVHLFYLFIPWNDLLGFPRLCVCLFPCWTRRGKLFLT